MGKFAEKTVAITGGTSGFGGELCKMIAGEGGTVIALARDAKRGQAFEEEVRALGLNVSFIACNVGDSVQVRKAHERILAEWGPIDILVNNAGILLTGALEDITDEDWDMIYQINVKSVLYMCKEFIGELKARRGTILNVSSIDGLDSYVKGSKSYMYATTKAAVIKMTQHLAKNYAPEVRVNCLCPGFSPTNLFTNRDFSRFDGCNLIERMILPEEISRIAMFLVSDDSACMTGSIIVADGGQSLKG